MKTWIQSAAPCGFTPHAWHLARVKESRGDKGTLFSTYEVAACHGRQIGGAWGYRSQQGTAARDGLILEVLARRRPCPRCLAIALKAST